MASVMAHLAACQAAATIVDPCTGARGANLPLDLRRGQPAGAHVLSKRSQRWMRLVLPTGWPGSISLRNDRSPTQKGTGMLPCRGDACVAPTSEAPPPHPPPHEACGGGRG